MARLAAAKARFLKSEFLAPVARGGEVQVRIAGVVCRLAVERGVPLVTVFWPNDGIKNVSVCWAVRT